MARLQDSAAMRRFVLIRSEDPTGISGTGLITEGIEFLSRKCVLSWLTEYTSVAMYDDIETLMKIHGHDGLTKLHWVDPEHMEIDLPGGLMR